MNERKEKEKYKVKTNGKEKERYMKKCKVIHIMSLANKANKDTTFMALFATLAHAGKHK